jgi:hypothetical protein
MSHNHLPWVTISAPCASRRWRRPAGAAVALAASLGMIASLSGCGGASESTASGPPSGSVGAELVQAQAGDVVAYVKARLAARQDYRARDSALVPFFAETGATGAVSVPVIGAPAAAAADASHSSTVLQEAGVDEDDLLKTDGTLLIALARSAAATAAEPPLAEVQVHARQSDGSLTLRSRTPLSGLRDQPATAQGLYFASDMARVAVLSTTQLFYSIDMCGGAAACPALATMPFAPSATRAQVWIDLLDMADPAAPVAAPRVKIDGTLLGSRRIGPYLYVVTQHQPVLPVDLLPADAPAATRDELLARLDADDVLPTRQIGSAAPELLTPETDCFLQSGNASPDLAITTITVLDLSRGAAPASGRCFVGGSEALYLAPESLYLATTRYAYDVTSAQPRFAEGMQTDLHKFALSGAALTYRGSGSVPGHLGWDAEKKSLRLSEHDGYLRVITHTEPWGWVQPQGTPATADVPPSPARLSVLHEAVGASRLDEVGALPNARRPEPLGKAGEQVYAVRLLGTLGYVVTFQRIDPLYVLDLSDPTDPRTLGEVEAAGFSDYLFPLGNGLLLGVGKDASAEGRVGGVKVAVFDVSDGSRPREAAKAVFGLAGSFSGLDVSRHGIDLHPVVGTVRVGLPLVTVDDPGFTTSTRGLQRLEVDLASGALAVRPMLAPASGNSSFSATGDDRSVQIGDHVYYWADEAFAIHAW